MQLVLCRAVISFYNAINFSSKFSILRGNSSPDSAKQQWLVLASPFGQPIPRDHDANVVLGILQQCEHSNVPSQGLTSAQLLRSHVKFKLSAQESRMPLIHHRTCQLIASSTSSVLQFTKIKTMVTTFLKQRSTLPAWFEKRGWNENAGHELQSINHLFRL